MNMTTRRILAFAAALVMTGMLGSCGSADENTADVKGDTAGGAAVGADNGEALAPAGETETADDGAAEAEAEIAAEEDFAAEAAFDTADTAAVAGEEKRLSEAEPSLEYADGADGAFTDDGMDTIEVPEDVPTNNGEAFVLTAGEWNDNENWGFFQNLIKNGTISFPAYGIDPTNRIAVTVTKDGAPSANQPVELTDKDGNIIWSAMTDKNGVAYVFYTSDDSPAEVRCAGGATAAVEPGSGDEQGRAGTAEVALEGQDTIKYDKTEVMFILDTTGSMYDEIAYLQMDFSSIAEETDDGSTTFSVNFYRDEGDEYVTRTNGFSSDIKEVQKLINKESADGGGDFPEAVAEILDETITSGQWSKDTNKIAFLIFDAPPHTGKEEQLKTAVKSAAAKGIHLVPVVASNSERDTELFGRAIAACTNSNYIFLTDDSGVGGGHLEPIIGDFDVELLHDIIVRNINEIRS